MKLGVERNAGLWLLPLMGEGPNSQNRLFSEPMFYEGIGNPATHLALKLSERLNRALS